MKKFICRIRTKFKISIEIFGSRLFFFTKLQLTRGRWIYSIEEKKKLKTDALNSIIWYNKSIGFETKIFMQLIITFPLIIMGAVCLVYTEMWIKPYIIINKIKIVYHIVECNSIKKTYAFCVSTWNGRPPFVIPKRNEKTNDHNFINNKQPLETNYCSKKTKQTPTHTAVQEERLLFKFNLVDMIFSFQSRSRVDILIWGFEPFLHWTYFWMKFFFGYEINSCSWLIQ